MKILNLRFILPALAVLAFGLAAHPALAAPGDLDPGFNGGVPAVIDDSPSASEPFGATINPANGDILWVGVFLGDAGALGRIAAYKPDGTLDTAVGSGGIISLSAAEAGFPGGLLSLQAIAVDDQGRMLVTGFILGSSGLAMVLVRFKPDGTLDTNFGAAGTGVVTDALNSFAAGTGLSLTDDGHILVTGTAGDQSLSAVLLTVWRFNPDGTADTDFGDGGHVQIAAISFSSLQRCFPALQPDRALLIGCQRTDTDSRPTGPWKITRLRPDGSVDSGFGAGGFVSGTVNHELRGLALAPDGGFVIAELHDTSASPPTVTLRRFNADGSVDGEFNGGNPFVLSLAGPSLIMPLAVQPDGKILVGFNYVVGAGAPELLGIVRLLGDGTLDPGFGNTGDEGLSILDFSDIGGNDYTPFPTALLLQGNGRIVVSGFADSSAGGRAAFVTRVLNDEPFDLAPDSVSFDDIARAPLGQAVVSNEVSVSGVAIGTEATSISVALAVEGGRYSTTGAGGPFRGSASGANIAQIGAGDLLALEQMTPNSAGTDTTTNVVVGGFWAPNNYQVPLGTAVAADWTTTTDQPPVAHDATLEATAGVPAADTLVADNPGGGTLTFSIVTTPSHGTLSLDDVATGAFTYTADGGYTGDDAFIWKVNDGVADSNMATVDITVSAANNPPVAEDGTLTTDEDTPASGTLVASDPDDDPLTFSLVGDPAHGGVTIDDTSTGAYTYTPDSGFSGNDSFTFKASDGVADSNTATISITVNAAPPPPPPPPPPPNDNGGGGGLGGFALALLALLAAAMCARRQRRPS